MSQFLDTNINDLILRAQMYRDIKLYVQSNDSSTTPHEVATDEAYRSDLISYRVYRRADLAWLVDILADREDRALALKIGSTIRFPELVYIRSKIKEYVTLESKIANG